MAYCDRADSAMSCVPDPRFSVLSCFIYKVFCASSARFKRCPCFRSSSAIKRENAPHCDPLRSPTEKQPCSKPGRKPAKTPFNRLQQRITDTCGAARIRTRSVFFYPDSVLRLAKPPLVTLGKRRSRPDVPGRKTKSGKSGKRGPDKHPRTLKKREDAGG